ncbi:MAG: glycine--tRNA ligase [Gemmatimonadaceae bacterium]|nr:glycine--tRNA ligase [Gemmatimonadaceae bacterium]
MSRPDVLETLVSLAKRRGFIFQSSEIYGGTGSVWDYGPLGVELKNNVKARWWNAMVRERDDVEGLDAAILMHPRTWEASGHVAGFSDPLVDCKACKARFRADKLADAQCPRKPSRKPGEHGDCQLTEPRQFNLMFKTFMGPVEDSAAVVYLRPETAQGIFVNFLNVQQATRQKVPFGIAQIGKAFRNEITPGNFTFRTREFEQMEMQFFVEPGTDMEHFERWKQARLDWHLGLGLDRDRLEFHQHSPQELAHYARAAFDINFDFGGTLGFQEIEGVHNRSDFDLTQHQQFSGKKLEYVDQVANKRYVPYVIETSVGADRVTLAILVNAYREEAVPGEQEGRVVMGFHPALAPIKAGIFPLTKKDGQPEMAERLGAALRKRFNVFYDEAGAIGRRYRRQDEAGTPFGITVDGDSTRNDDVTIRFRDDMGQIRVSTSRVADVLTQYIEADHARAEARLVG